MKSKITREKEKKRRNEKIAQGEDKERTMRRRGKKLCMKTTLVEEEKKINQEYPRIGRNRERQRTSERTKREKKVQEERSRRGDKSGKKIRYTRNMKFKKRTKVPTVQSKYLK